MPRLRSPSCRFEVGVSETVADWALKQLCWTWVTEGFWRFSSLIVPETGPLKKPILSTSSESLKSQAPYEEMLPREASGETRACWGHCLVYQDGKRWETYLSILILSSSASVQWMEMTGMLRIVSSCKVWLHSTRFRTTCSVCQFPGASCSSKGNKRRGPFVQQMP
jgi:hypothetical protein